MSKPSQQEIGLVEAPGINAGFCRDGSQREPGRQLLSPPHPAPIFLSHLSSLRNNEEETVLSSFFLKKQTEQNALPAEASAVVGGSQEKMGGRKREAQSTGSLSCRHLPATQNLKTHHGVSLPP